MKSVLAALVAYVSQAATGAVARAESALFANPRDVERLIALGLASPSGCRHAWGGGA